MSYELNAKSQRQNVVEQICQVCPPMVNVAVIVCLRAHHPAIQFGVYRNCWQGIMTINISLVVTSVITELVFCGVTRNEIKLIHLYGIFKLLPLLI